MAKLKDNVKDLSEVPEGARDFYVKNDDGGYVLDRDGDDGDPKRKIREFRERNIDLDSKVKLLEAKLEKFNGIDPDKYVSMSETMSKLGEDDDAKLIKDGRYKEVLGRHTEVLKADNALKLAQKDKIAADERARAERAEKKLNARLIKDDLMEELGRSKLKILGPGALRDLVSRAHDDWEVRDEKTVAMDKGKPKYGKDGEELKWAEWLQDQLEVASHCFERSEGSGAPGSKGDFVRGKGVIPAGDKKAFFDNVEGIAKAKVQVR